MTSFHLTAAAALTECACSSGRVRMVQSVLAADDPMWAELLKTNLEPLGIEVCEVELDWIDRYGVAVLVLELAFERPASNEVRMSSIVANAFESIRRSARLGDEQRIASRIAVLSDLEREATDLSRYVDVVTTAMLEHGTAPDLKIVATEAESFSVQEFVRIVDHLFALENISWECSAVS